MKQPTIKDLTSSGMDIRRTIATEGKGLKAFTRDHKASRLKRNQAAYKASKNKR